MKFLSQIEKNPSMDSLKSKVTYIMTRYLIKPNSKYGQNFLVDENAINEMCKSVENKTILEIGPGTGFITKKILDSAKKVYAVEIDDNLIKYLNIEFCEYIESKKLEIINSDILEIDLEKFIKKNNIKQIISAPPYNISTELMYKLLNININIILLMQQDFILKLKNYEYYSPSALSVILNYFYEVKLHKKVNSSSFFPTPKVNSQIFELIPRKKRMIRDEELFIRFIKEIFRYINKSLSKVVKIMQKNVNDKKMKKIIDFLEKEDPKFLEGKVNEIGYEDYVNLFIDLERS